MKLNFLLPRCERCDRRLGPNHDPKSCIKRSLNRRHFLMAGAGIVAVAFASTVGFPPTPELDNALRAALRAEWLRVHPWAVVPQDIREAGRLAAREALNGYWARHPIILRSLRQNPDIVRRHQFAQALVVNARASA